MRVYYLVRECNHRLLLGWFQPLLEVVNWLWLWLFFLSFFLFCFVLLLFGFFIVVYVHHFPIKPKLKRRQSCTCCSADRCHRRSNKIKTETRMKLFDFDVEVTFFFFTLIRDESWVGDSFICCCSWLICLVLYDCLRGDRIKWLIGSSFKWIKKKQLLIVFFITFHSLVWLKLNKQLKMWVIAAGRSGLKATANFHDWSVSS